MELEIISKMKVDELKDFLRLRGLKVSGRKEELIARVFVAHENNVPLVKSAEEVQQEVAMEYANKLQVEDETLPDPFQLQDALFRIESAIRIGLNSPSCTSKPCSWLPSNKNVAPVKIKDLKLGRGDFGQRGKKKAELNCSPKKRYDPTINMECSLSLQEVTAAIKGVCDSP
eukprot:gene1194-biopygen418